MKSGQPLLQGASEAASDIQYIKKKIRLEQSSDSFELSTNSNDMHIIKLSRFSGQGHSRRCLPSAQNFTQKSRS